MSEPQNGRIGGGVLKDNLERQGVNLNFKNTSGNTALLHLDVNNLQIGVNNEAPTDVLTIPSQIRTINLIGTYANVSSFEIGTSSINNLSGDINLNAATDIFATAIATDDLKIDFNTISTTTADTNIEIRPDGLGELNIRSNWNITGNLHSTGNVTFGGDLILGDSDLDTVTFDSDVNSNIIPDLNNTSALGSPTKKWLSLYSNLLNGQRVEVSSVTVGDTSLALRQGNIFYVSTLGSDTNVGDHQHGAFRTLKHALEVIDLSTLGPVTIHIYPGVYEEELPLTVPNEVTISGEDIRNTIIVPTALTQTNDVFLIEGSATIENITIKDFYSPGYAFRYASGGLITTRSPYIKNVSVITQGSIITADDPRGFAAGDAGKGAYIDGSELDPASVEATMLFHSCTFITPGVDAITMTNGVRVEWLNSFTYFANIGLYATQGVDGKVLSDGSTLRYGAEIRSIGSANLYGNYGAIADGADTLMYLIGHNFAYIGTGKNVTNDKTLVIQSQETTELNSGRIYYTSTDANGTFRVGNSFYIDFETGATSIDASQVDFSGIGAITIRNGVNVTYIDGSRIDTGNVRFNGNTITTINGDLNLTPVTEILNLNTNPGLVLAKGNNLERTNLEADIRYNTTTNLFEGFSTANLSFGGLYSDNRATSVDVNNTLNSIDFRVAGVKIGGVVAGAIQLNGLSNEDILINNNRITTTLSNSDLELRRSGDAIVDVYDFSIKDSVIKNLSNNTFDIAATGPGYTKFNGTTGLVVPSGTTAERLSSPTAGTTRWNTDEKYLETYDGTIWQRSAGTGEEVTEDIMRELVDIYTLVLG
jgi:hypothetical protein